MSVLTAARAQMELSLAFHMVFAALGIGMPVLMLIAEGLWLRTRREHYRELARTWGKATALTFAIGAVSGTALSFELGLLWPRFMAFAGGVIGSAFALEAYAFFIEAIFLGLYLYGWDRLSPRAHWLTGFPVAISGLMSGVLVVAANAWMQAPTGFVESGGELVSADPFAPFRSPAWLHMALHSTLSCYIATGFAAAGVYAMGMLRGRRDDYHRSALAIAMAVGAASAVVQPLSGDLSARRMAEYQPAKLAAMEAHFETTDGAPLIIGGVPDVEQRTVRWALRIPGGLSWLLERDPNARVDGLDAVPRGLWPNVTITHFAFQVMVACGFALIALSAVFWLMRWRRAVEPRRWLSIALVAGSPLGFLALESGWVVTEVGRQPWVVYGVMRTADGVTPVADVPITLLGFTVLYVGLGVALTYLLLRLARPPRASGQEGEVSRGA